MMLPQLSKVGDQEKKDYRRGRSWPPTQNPNCPGPARPGTPAHSWSDSAANLPFHPADPDWASYKLGIFICLHCSGVHRNFPDVSKVKSVRLDFWDDSMVEFMTHNGNLNVKAKFEARVPAFYYVPQVSDCLVLANHCGNGKTLQQTQLTKSSLFRVLKEQWIRAKYERREFMADEKAVSPPGDREVFLWKRGRNNAQFLRRRFVLLAREGLLKYYTKEEGKTPKAVINIKDLNATFQTEKIGHPHGLQITYRREGHTRNLFVYHDSGKDAFEQGQVLLGRNGQGYEVCEDLPKGTRGNRWKAGLTVITPERKFIFTCPSEKEQREWLESLRDVLSSPLSPLQLLSENRGWGVGLGALFSEGRKGLFHCGPGRA
ncbi:hypothetical protein NN561_003207 [Cricetulus griseus]